MNPSAAPTRARDAHARPRARGRLRPFRAIDGESVTLEGEHRYVVAVTSEGQTTQDLAGLSTRECLNFVVRAGRAEPSSILVAFGLNYDVNMWLRDLPLELLIELWQEGAAKWEPDPETTYWLEWVPGKLFSVYAELGDARGQAKVYDVFGFFQCSFVRALERWGIGESGFVAQMKEHRSDFAADELDEITRYSIEECRLLVQLMEDVRAALHDVELRPRSWLGAGAIAATLLTRELVHEHLPRSRSLAPAVEETFLRAYYGGRTEVFRQGVFDEAEAWDINSAYPAAAVELPSLRSGAWKRSREYDPAERWAIWRCSWELPDDELLAPFPFRNKRAIAYPLSGEGWYHAAEVAAAIELYGDAIRPSSGYVFSPGDEERPFSFLPAVYAYRQQLKAEGHPGEKVLKLGINSVYGKLAQGNSRDGRRPRFQSYFWAGAITAQTRARVLRAGAQARGELVAIATDGLLYAPRGPGPALPIEPGLGGWERTRYRRVFVAQPGMYHATDRSSNSVVRHSRGFFTKEINFGKLRRLWLSSGPCSTLVCPSTRFVGLGAALCRKDFSVWRSWQQSERRLSLYLAPRKGYADEEPEPIKQLYPPPVVRGGLSDPYTPKRAAVELDEDQAEWVQGTEQPLRVF